MINKSVRLSFSGNSLMELVERFRECSETSRREGVLDVNCVRNGDRLAITVHVLQMKRPNSLDQAIAYAGSCVRRGTTEVATVLWDGTVVRITSVERPSHEQAARQPSIPAP